MPRTYYEWKNAQHKWFMEQGKIIASIPYPTEDGITYPVVYERDSPNPYWLRRKEAAVDLVPKSIKFNFKESQIAQFFEAAEKFEREKEDRFLQKFYGGTWDPQDTHTDKFNILLQSRDLYKEINDRIQHIITAKQFEKNKTYGQKNGATHEYFTGPAPNLSAVFMTYFMKYFESTALPNLYKQITQTMASNDIYLDALDQLMDDAIYEAIELASVEMAAILQENDNGQGWGAEWKPVLEVLQKGDPRFQKMFLNTVKEAIGPNLLANLRDEMRGARRNKTRVSSKLIRDLSMKSLGNIRGQTLQKGGLIKEVVAPIIAEYFNGQTFGNGDLKGQIYTQRLGSPVTRTDYMMLFHGDANFDLGQFSNELKKVMESGNSSQMKQIADKLDGFYKWQSLQQDLDELFTVYVNAKNYSVGHDAGSYTLNEHGRLEELPAFLQANGIEVGSASQFLSFAYNTGEGAIRSGYRQEVMENAVNALKAAAANLMFDDYAEIGHGDTNSIHVYDLSGKFVPASEVFKVMKNATTDTSTRTKATVVLPGPINDLYQPDSPPDYGYGGESDAEVKQAILRHWHEEADEARRISEWSVSFTLKIKNLLGTIK